MQPDADLCASALDPHQSLLPIASFHLEPHYEKPSLAS